jgi:hypothetical protein
VTLDSPLVSWFGKSCFTEMRMKEFDAFEIEQSTQDTEVKLGFCPILRANCHGELCMWWVRHCSESKNQLQASCAVTLIAIGMNDEGLHQAKKER